MKSYTAVIERCRETNLYCGYIPGMPGAYTQGETIEELRRNLIEVIELLREEGEEQTDSDFVGTQLVEGTITCRGRPF